MTSGEDFAEVVAAAQAGQEWAFAVLYRRHNPAVLRFLRARAGAEGDDLASQAWLDVARNLSSFEGGEDGFAGWVFTISRRRLMDHYRRESRRNQHPVQQRLLAELRPAQDTAEAAVELLAGDDAARRIAELLPAGHAEIVLLRVVAGLSVEEVAQVTGRRPGTVRVIQHRALRRLAEALDRDV